MNFINKVTRKNLISIYFSPKFDNITVWLDLFHTNTTDETMYNNWTFANSSVMDDFYFSKNTTLLIETVGYKVGNTSLKSTYLNVDFHRRIDVNYETSKKILGFPIQFIDN